MHYKRRPPSHQFWSFFTTDFKCWRAGSGLPWNYFLTLRIYICMYWIELSTDFTEQQSICIDWFCLLMQNCSTPITKVTPGGNIGPRTGQWWCESHLIFVYITWYQSIWTHGDLEIFPSDDPILSKFTISKLNPRNNELFSHLIHERDAVVHSILEDSLILSNESVSEVSCYQT